MANLVLRNTPSPDPFQTLSPLEINEPEPLLCEDLLWIIFKYALALDRPKQPLQHHKALPLGTVRLLSRRWKEIADKELLVISWKTIYRHPSLRPFHKTIKNVELRCQKLEAELVGNLTQPPPSLLPFALLSKALNSTYLGILPSSYTHHVDHLLNTALEHTWKRIKEQTNLEEVPPLGTAHIIRDWLSDPTHTEQIRQIVKLDLGRLDLIAAPIEINQFASLRQLNLSSNFLNSFPYELSHLSALTNLNMDNNQLQTLPSEIGNLTTLASLSLDNNRLQTIPPEIGHLTSLIWLDLSHNEIQILPPQIGLLPKLKELYLSHNALHTFPHEIVKLSTLTHLAINQNRIKTFPSPINQLNALQFFSCEQNFPQPPSNEIYRLTNLTMLDLSHNQLQTISPEIKHLISLQELHLSHNALEQIPPETGNLTALTILNFSHNKLPSLPPELIRLSLLSNIFLNENPLLFLFDCEFKQCASSTLRETLLKHEAGRQYICQTPLAAFCQSLHCEEDLIPLQSTFSQLPEDLQNQIEAGIPSSSETPPNLFANRAALAHATIALLQKKHQALSEPAKKLAYWHVWNLAGRPSNNETWGKIHAPGNILRWIDAIELATQGSCHEPKKIQIEQALERQSD